MKALPFTTLGTEFKAPMWERVSWPTVPSEPDMPPSVVLKQENEDDVLKSKLTANPSNSKQEENVLECSELEKGEPKQPKQLDNQDISQNLDSIVRTLQSAESSIHNIDFSYGKVKSESKAENNENVNGEESGKYMDDSFENED